jgi:predicted nucleotidyltransferase
MDTKQAVSIASEFARKVALEVAPAEIILYGSYAKNSATETSDIDVAVIFDEYNGDRLEASKRLWRMAWESEGYIEPVILESLHDKSGFLSDIRKHGIVLYQANH